MDINDVEKINNLARSLKAHNLAANINEAIRMATEIIKREKKGKIQEQAKKAVQEEQVFIGKPVALEESKRIEEPKPLFEESIEEPAEAINVAKIDLDEDAEEILGEEEQKAKEELAAEEPNEKVDTAADDYDITQEDKTIAELLGETKKEEEPAAEDHSEEIKQEIEEEIAEVKALQGAEETIEEELSEEIKPVPLEEIKEELPEEIKEDKPEDTMEEELHEEIIEEEKEPHQEEKKEGKPKPEEKDDSEGWVDWTEDYKGK